MESFSLQVMLKDGSFADYEVNELKKNEDYEVMQDNNKVILLNCNANSEWTVVENPGNADEDLQQRIINQLNGFRL